MQTTQEVRVPRRKTASSMPNTRHVTAVQTRSAWRCVCGVLRRRKLLLSSCRGFARDRDSESCSDAGPSLVPTASTHRHRQEGRGAHPRRTHAGCLERSAETGREGTRWLFSGRAILRPFCPGFYTDTRFSPMLYASISKGITFVTCLLSAIAAERVHHDPMFGRQ